MFESYRQLVFIFSAAMAINLVGTPSAQAICAGKCVCPRLYSDSGFMLKKLDLELKISQLDVKIESLNGQAQGLNQRILDRSKQQRINTQSLNELAQIESAMQMIASMSGETFRVIRGLKQLMDQSEVEKSNLASWHKLLADIRPKLPTQLHASADALLIEIDLAIKSQDRLIINDIIGILNSPEKNSLDRIKASWLSMSVRLMKENEELVAEIRANQERVKANLAEAIGLVNERLAFANQLKEHLGPC